MKTSTTENDPLNDVRLLDDVEEPKKPQEDDPQYSDDVRNSEELYRLSNTSDGQDLFTNTPELNNANDCDIAIGYRTNISNTDIISL